MDRQSRAASDNRHNRESSGSPKKFIQHCHANARMVENVLLVWLDHSIDEDNDNECLCIVTKLRSVISTKTFTDGKKCVEYINNLRNEKVCMMISGSLGQNMVPYVHPASYVDSIYIFCRNRSLHEVWTKEWPKIKGIQTSSIPICEALKLTVQQAEQNSVSIAYIPTKHHTSNHFSNELELSFLLIQTLKEIIMMTNFDGANFQQMVKYSRDVFANKESDLKDIDEFEKSYYEKAPVWWYSNKSFLYSMLQRGLRMVDVNTILNMDSFIRDLHSQIKQLHREQFNEMNMDNNFTVYHGQSLSKSTFEQMAQTKSGFISFTSFLCASTDRRVSFDFAHRAATNPDSVGIFFVITIDPSKTKASFAFINEISQFEGKDEVLFPMHTIFVIRGIQSMGDSNHVFQVDLTLPDDYNEDFRALNNRLREETYPNSKGWDRVGQLLIKLEKFDKARQIYSYLLKQTTNENVKKQIDCQLGKIKDFEMLDQEAGALQRSASGGADNSLSVNHPIFGKLRKSFKDLKKKIATK